MTIATQTLPDFRSMFIRWFYLYLIDMYKVEDELNVFLFDFKLITLCTSSSFYIS